MTHKNVLSLLTELAKFSSPSSSSFNCVLQLNVAAFEQKKPLFEPDDKNAAAAALQISLSLFEPAFRILNGGMEIERRQDAQVYRSGLQYIADEMNDVPVLHEQFEELLACKQIKQIEEYIENTTGVSTYTYSDKNIDLNSIPSSHYWWFYPNDEDDSE